MKRFKVSKITVGFIFLVGIILFAQNVQASTILGVVYDNQRNPLSDVDVELLDEFYRMQNRAKTDGTGRYEFSGLKDGRYSVRVLAFRYDFIDETASVEVNTITSGVAGQVGNGFIPQDFYLQPKKGSLLEAELAVIFAQAIPKEAEKIYGNALKSLVQKKTDEGILQLRESVKLFPNYYLALHRLGRELYFKGEYGESAQMSLKATEVNPKSGTSFYYLGNSLSKLNYNKAAIVALNQALTIAPASVQVLFALGKAQSAEGKYTAAEKHFLDAKKFSKTAIPDIHWELAQLYGNGFKKYKEAADELELYLKAGKFDDNHTKQIRKIINNMREKQKPK